MSVFWRGIFIVLFFLILLAGPVYAGEITEDGGDNNDPLRLTMNHTGLIHLQEDADSVILNNPDNAGVTIDNPRLLIVTPYKAGATSMMVLDSNKNVILQKDIIISNVQKSYVRIRRVCNGSNAGCQSTSYSYCPDGCYDVTEIQGGANNASNTPPPPESKPGLIGGEPAETLIGPADECPEGYQKVYVPGITSGDQHYTCTR